MARAITNADEIPTENQFKKSMGVIGDELKKYKRLTKQESALLIPAQAAAMIGISPQAMERKIKDGSIKSFAVMGKVWVSGNQIEELMVIRIKKLVEAGEDKNKIEESMYKKMYLNAKSVKSKRASKK